MAKLYFRYGTVGSAKTMNLLAVRHNYERQGKKVLLCKPAMEDRFGKTSVTSRSGLTHEADVLLDDQTEFYQDNVETLSCILVDEAQFLSPFVVEMLRRVATFYDVPVICYGLRTDFRMSLFPGSQRLMELADTIEEIKNTCQYCNKKAVFNLRHDPKGGGTISGPVVLLGGDETYSPTCYRCYIYKIDVLDGMDVHIKNDSLRDLPIPYTNEELLSIIHDLDDAYDNVAYYACATTAREAHLTVVDILVKMTKRLEALIASEA